MSEIKMYVKYQQTASESFDELMYVEQDGMLIPFYSEGISRETKEHVVKCVNEHDALVAEVEKLKQLNIGLLNNKAHWCNSYYDAEAEVERLIELIVDSGQCIIIKECPAGDCKHCIRDYLKERDEIEKISRESDAFDSEMNCGADAYEDTES